jgi:Protein of unknown function (DUF2917)
MHTDLKLALTHLARGELLQLRNGRGKGVAVFDGHVWVTQDSDPQDHVLSPGESFAVDRSGLVIVQALSDASLLVFDLDTSPGTAAPAHADSKSAASREHHEKPAWVEVYLEARRQRALAIGDAIGRGFAALGRLWLGLRNRVGSDVSGARPAVHGR